MIEEYRKIIESLPAFPQKVIELAVPLLLYVAAGLLIIKIILTILRKALKKSKYDASVHHFIIVTAKIILIVFLCITVMGKIGIQTGSFIAALGACGVAIALALKDSLGNVAGGIVIIINRPFVQGDYIQINEYKGSVQEVRLLTTLIKTEDGKITIIPNGIVTNSVLINYSRNDIRRVDCVFSIDYEDDIMLAKETLRKVGRENRYVIDQPEPETGVLQHGSGQIDIIFNVWCRRGTYYETKYSVEEDVKIAFDKAGIRCPLEKIEIHTDDDRKDLKGSEKI